MKRRVLASVVAVLLRAAAAHAHGGGPGHIDEGPASPTWITVVMVVSWIVIAFGIVLFVLRLIRQKNLKERGDKREEA